MKEERQNKDNKVIKRRKRKEVLPRAAYEIFSECRSEVSMNCLEVILLVHGQWPY
jgi:hypothetical protein